MKTEKPYGKGFTGFIIGLLLATLIIGGLVYVLEITANATSKTRLSKKNFPLPKS